MENIKKLFDKKDARSLKYYLAFCTVILSIYVYSMSVGWRFLSYGEGSHKKDRTTTRIYHHK